MYYCLPEKLPRDTYSPIHERLHVVDGDEVVDSWPVDLAYW
jgi:hypothetical protein